MSLRGRQCTSFISQAMSPVPSNGSRAAMPHEKKRSIKCLRAHLFIDLHAILKRTVRASVEQYSLKALGSFALRVVIRPMLNRHPGRDLPRGHGHQRPERDCRR